MNSSLTRRGFLGGISAFGAFAGCSSFPGASKPLLRFGVVSDVHVRLADSGTALTQGFSGWQSCTEWTLRVT